MPDWQALVRQRMGTLGLEAEREHEIIAELAGHLEDLYDEWRCQGLPAEEAVARARRHVSDWAELSRDIRRAEREGGSMNHRTKCVWLPGLFTLTLAMALLGVMIQAGVQPRYDWRTPYHPLEWNIPWLLGLPFIGAFGAYWSRYAGGGLLARLAAGLLPAASLAGLFILVLPIDILLDVIIYRNHRLDASLIGFAVGMLNWVVVPGCALLVGILPFLRKPRRNRRSAEVAPSS